MYCQAVLTGRRRARCSTQWIKYFEFGASIELRETGRQEEKWKYNNMATSRIF